MEKSKPSKSARKREDLELQQLGERLLALPIDVLDAIELDARLREAVLEARGISARGALRRQKQYIGKLMRHTDPEPIRRALDRLGSEDRRRKAVFREAERWRDRVATEGQAAVDALADCTGLRDPVLAQLVGELSGCRHEASRRRLLRRIFREVHRALTMKMQSGPG